MQIIRARRPQRKHKDTKIKPEQKLDVQSNILAVTIIYIKKDNMKEKLKQKKTSKNNKPTRTDKKETSYKRPKNTNNHVM